MVCRSTGQQQPSEIALRQQHHLPELITFETEDPFDLLANPGLFVRHQRLLPARRVELIQLGAFADLDGPGAPLSRHCGRGIRLTR